MHHQVDFAIDRNRKLGGDNVIARFDIVGGIEAEKVLVSFVNLIGMNGAKFSVGTGVTEVESELPRLRLNLQGVGFGGGKVNFRPRFLAQYAEGQDFRSDKDESGDDHEFGTARKMHHFRACFAIRVFPDKESEDELGKDERQSSL